MTCLRHFRPLCKTLISHLPHPNLTFCPDPAQDLIKFMYLGIYLYFMCMNVGLQACVCTLCIPDVGWGQERALDPLQLGLETAVSIFGV